MSEPVTAEQYLAKQRKKVECPSCHCVFEIQKVKVADIYQKFIDLKEDMPNFEDIKDKSQEELAKHPLILSTLGVILMVGSYQPKIDVQVDLSKNTLSVGSLEECCLKFVTEQILEFSNMSQKAETARRMFSVTEPAKTLGMAALLTNGRPSAMMDPRGERFTDFEAAALDCAIITGVKKDIQNLANKRTTIDEELDSKYNEWNARLRLWS